MEKEFWHNKWKHNEIGFHSLEVTSTLKKFGRSLLEQKKGHIFLPLCGKSLDLIWFSKRVEQVSGVEISQKAVLDFFQENNLDFIKKEVGDFEVFQAGNITLYCGDIFRLPISRMNIDIVFDRASLVALPLKMRRMYYEKFKKELKMKAQWLLCTFSYPQGQMEGPPFSVSKDEIISYLDRDFRIEVLEDVASDCFDMKGLRERVYLLEK